MAGRSGIPGMVIHPLSFPPLAGTILSLVAILAAIFPGYRGHELPDREGHAGDGCAR